ncbi:MAG: hypothetical protein AAFY14_03770 [Pseudomonadota bacterium]
MDTTLTFAPKTVAAIPYVAEREPPRDNKVPVVKGFEGAATLPANKPFVAQVVSARLSGAEFPAQPGEIAPSDRTLRPYGTPMLPSEDRADPRPATQEAAAEKVKAEDKVAQPPTDLSAKRTASTNDADEARLSTASKSDATETAKPEPVADDS